VDTTVSETTQSADVPAWVPPATVQPPPTTAASATPGHSPAAEQRGKKLTQLVFTAANDLVPHVWYQLSRLGPAGVVGAAASAAAAVIATFTLFSLQAANDNLNSMILRAQHHRDTPITPEQGLTRVVDQLPRRAQMPAVLGQVYQQAQAAGIQLAKGQYSYRPAAKSDVGSYELDFPVTGQYPAIRDFINRIMTNIPAAGLHKLTVQRKVVGDPLVNADVRFVLFVRDK
jgi:hypothetical protein